ncbi:MAG TPA: DNA repair exonuclease [Desulfomicrobiaceae bacterium]|nr:DNA repair exonuclease [Desulfomicrobiaceae bacterium]
MFKFIHAADLHLDSPLQKLERYEGVPVDEVRGATRHALENLVDLALAEEVALVILAGDLYDGDWKDYNTGLFLNAQMVRLQEGGVRVLLIRGNHDAANTMTKSLRLPENVRSFSEKRPETEILEDLGVAVHGQSFASRAETDNLAAGYPDPVPGMFNIGMLHSSVTGREGHENYAPCSLETLTLKGYDYWALGHAHTREILSRTPFVAYSGNIQGRHARETGPRGCWLVTVDDGIMQEPEFRELDTVRWELVSVDLTGARTGSEAVDRAVPELGAAVERGEERPVIVRIEMGGGCPADVELRSDIRKWENELRSRAQEIGRGRIWVEKVVLNTRAPDHGERLGEGPLQEIMALLDELEADDETFAGLCAELEGFWAKVPPELRRGRDSLAPGNPDRIRDLLGRVRPLLLDRFERGEA